MDEKIMVVFHGFLNLKTKEKLQLINEINNYFDSNDRDQIRREAEEKFKSVDWNSPELRCQCCGR